MAQYQDDECGIETQSSWARRVGHAKEIEASRVSVLEARCADLEDSCHRMDQDRQFLMNKCAWQAEMISRAKRIIEMVETVDEPIEDWLSDLSSLSGKGEING